MSIITLMIKSIHESNLKGTFVEVGAGMPVSSKLLNVEGASNTVIKAICPYSKDVLLDEYLYIIPGDYSDIRAVSYIAVKAIVEIERNKQEDYEEGNFVYASSFQLGDDICNHGWIGVYFKGDYYFYHLTLSANLTREENIDYLGEVGINIMFGLINKDIYIPAETDIIFDDAGIIQDDLMFPESGDYYSVFTPTKEVKRLEEVYRGSEGVIIYKGSFNPLHEGHIEIMDRTKKLYPNYPVALMISMDTHGKNKVDKYDLSKRIKVLNEAGYYVIITEFPYFILNAIDLNERLKCEIVFPMGIDTYERLEDHEIDRFPVLGAVGVVFSRNHQIVDIDKSNFIAVNDNIHQEISSTKLRNNDFMGL